MSWQIWYSDGHVITSEDMTPFSIPRGRRRGVQVITQPSMDQRGQWVTTCGDDHYVWDDRFGEVRWWGCDDFGLYDYLLAPGSKCILFGETIGNQRFGEIFLKATEMLGKKHTFSPGERRP